MIVVGGSGERMSRACLYCLYCIVSANNASRDGL